MAINILVSRAYAKLGYELYRYDINMGFSSIKRIDTDGKGYEQNQSKKQI